MTKSEEANKSVKKLMQTEPINKITNEKKDKALHEALYKGSTE